MALRSAKAVATPLVKPDKYQARWWMQDGPNTRFRTFYRRKEFEGYSTDTWIYTLTLYGGPERVTFNELLGKNPPPRK